MYVELEHAGTCPTAGYKNAYVPCPMSHVVTDVRCVRVYGFAKSDGHASADLTESHTATEDTPEQQTSFR